MIKGMENVRTKKSREKSMWTKKFKLKSISSFNFILSFIFPPGIQLDLTDVDILPYLFWKFFQKNKAGICHSHASFIIYLHNFITIGILGKT